jgi:hypothetical protein
LPFIETTLTIAPPPLLRIHGSTARMAWISASTFWLKAFTNSSSAMLSKRPGGSAPETGSTA